MANEDASLAQGQAPAAERPKNAVPPSEPLLVPDLHVVLIAWKRVYLLKHQLRWLQGQVGLNGRRVRLHVLVNNPDAADEVRSVVASFTRPGGERDLIVERTGGLVPMEVTVADAWTDQHYNFARFVYVGRLRDEVPLDHVVFLDDDQYWHETFLSSLLGAHGPRGMTTWYGKRFVVTNVAAGGSSGNATRHALASYMRPSISYSDITRGEQWPEVLTFKYGGTGGSIFDANLWLLDSQLMRLAGGDLARWAKVDDLWASYVMDALLGWEVRRLPPPSMALDVGKFHQSEEYRRDATRSLMLRPRVGEELMGLKEEGRDVRGVATFMDPSVDKQGVFEELQTRFMWDVGDG